jgi:hypothetical protein
MVNRESRRNPRVLIFAAGAAIGIVVAIIELDDQGCGVSSVGQVVNQVSGGFIGHFPLEIWRDDNRPGTRHPFFDVYGWFGTNPG